MDDIDQVIAELDKLVGRSEKLADEAVASKPRRVRLPVSVQPKSSNRKLAPQRTEIAKSGRKRFVPVGPYVTSTYVSISATCPDSCVYKDNGCYAQAGATHLTMGPLDRAAATGWDPDEVTEAEARAIDQVGKTGIPRDGAAGGRDLRLHVGGEVSSERGAWMLAQAAKRWRLRGGGDVWTFTARWREIPRPAWGEISVLASCQTEADVVLAVELGYVPAITVEDFKGRLDVGGLRLLPCPWEANGKLTCAECRACLDDMQLLRDGRGIAFRLHGSQAEKARRSLRVLNG